MTPERLREIAANCEDTSFIASEENARELRALADELEAKAAPAHPGSVRLIPISDDWRGDLAHQIATIMDGEFHDGYDSLMALTVATRIIAETQRAIDKAMAAASIGKSDDERRICIHKPEVLTADGTVICKRCGERIRLAWGDTWILDESVTRPTTERTR